MELEQMISKMRIFRKAVLEGSHQNIEMMYQVPNVHTCFNPTFIDKGYYKRHNGEYCICEKNKENSDFRLLECCTCHHDFYLMNSGVKNWDNALLQENSKCKVKKS